MEEKNTSAMRTLTIKILLFLATPTYTELDEK
jgi:hypothetical protein